MEDIPHANYMASRIELSLLSIQTIFHEVYFSPDNSMYLQLAPYSPVQDGKSGLETAETSLSAGRFTLYMLLKSWSDTEGARNPCQIARHQASKGPTQPFNGCAFQAL